MSQHHIWDDAIASLFPLNLSGQVMALRASIDASRRTNSGVFALAAVAYGFDRAVKANREWERLMDGRRFHMTDLNARKGDFAGMTSDEVNRLMKGLVSIVNKHASYFLAVSCDEALIADSLPVISSPDRHSRAMLEAFRSVYGLICHLGMFTLGEMVRWQVPDASRQISYIFELGDEGQKGLIRYLEFITERGEAEQFLDEYSLARQIFTGKDGMEGIFHSADLVAWEWSKHIERRNAGLEMRKSLTALIGDALEGSDSDGRGYTVSDGRRCYFRHYDDKALQRMLTAFRGTLAASSPEEIEAAFKLWEESR